VEFARVLASERARSRRFLSRRENFYRQLSFLLPSRDVANLTIVGLGARGRGEATTVCER
jgi:hypothetical protein